MSFEAEVVPLFIGGVFFVSLSELIAGWILLRGQMTAQLLFTGHVLSMAAAFVFLICALFSTRLGIVFFLVSISNSICIGLFGLLWALSVVLLILLLLDMGKKQR